ncbi:MAG: 50S ribosomal protein L4 [Verrucomicrobia bacterium]|nr:MAG: 50S ribosomal protein L4 [Verrucomicrobiota bacterium]
MKLTVRDQNGANVGEVEVGFELVPEEKGLQAVHDVVVAHRAACRQGTVSTKTRSTVAGSGKKPWRQKGTGRARAGSRRSPLWRGGAIVHGPLPRDYHKKVNRRTKQLALRKALTERLKEGAVVLVQELSFAKPRTKDFVKVLEALQLDGTVLVVHAGDNEPLILSSRNVPGVETTTGDLLHTYDVLCFDKLVFTLAAWERVQERLKESA